MGGFKHIANLSVHRVFRDQRVVVKVGRITTSSKIRREATLSGSNWLGKAPTATSSTGLSTLHLAFGNYFWV